MHQYLVSEPVKSLEGLRERLNTMPAGDGWELAQVLVLTNPKVIADQKYVAIFKRVKA